MRSVKSVRPSEREITADDEAIAEALEAAEAYDDETYELFRVNCPDCGQPIALLADEEALPEHALCATRWDPFGLTVCPGSGRAAAEAVQDEAGLEPEEGHVAALLTLPEGLDWRMQPFSHAGGPRPKQSQARAQAQAQPQTPAKRELPAQEEAPERRRTVRGRTVVRGRGRGR